MSNDITVTGSTIQDVRYKLGIRVADIQVNLVETDRGGVRIIVTSSTGPFTFFKVKQAAAHIAGLLMAHQMRLIARNRNTSLKKKGGIRRQSRPNPRRRK